MHSENRSRGVSVSTDDSDIATENAIASKSASEIATRERKRDRNRERKRDRNKDRKEKGEKTQEKTQDCSQAHWHVRAASRALDFISHQAFLLAVSDTEKARIWLRSRQKIRRKKVCS